MTKAFKQTQFQQLEFLENRKQGAVLKSSAIVRYISSYIVASHFVFLIILIEY